MIRWLFSLGIILAMAAGCGVPGTQPPANTPAAITPAPAPTKGTSGVATVPAEDGPALLARAVQGLERSSSYRFTVEAVHHWRDPEGKEHDWNFTGEGAAIPPDSFYSIMVGPADTLWAVRIIKGKVTNVDPRGELAQPSTSFGGPGVGAAPLTAISYLKNSAARGEVQAASIDGTEMRRFSFTPDLARVAAVDASHGVIKDKVKTVQGTAWVDTRTGRLAQETVIVESLDVRGVPQTVTVTLRFSGYDSPVSIQ